MIQYKQLRQVRDKRGYSQEFVALKLDTCQQTVSDWETFKQAVPDDKAAALANLYEVELQDLIDDPLTRQQEIIRLLHMVIDTKTKLEAKNEQVIALLQMQLRKRK